MNGELYPGEFEAMERQGRLDAIMPEQVMMTREQAITTKNRFWNEEEDDLIICPLEQEPKGHWEETRYRSYDPQSCETYDDGMGFKCSNCAHVFKVTSLDCPNCGAKMVNYINMSNEEAIEMIDTILEVASNRECNDVEIDAFMERALEIAKQALANPTISYSTSMNIEALEQEPTEEAPVAAVHMTSEQKEAIRLAIGQLEAEAERLLKEADKKLEEGSKLNNMAKIYVDNMDELRRMIE